MSVEELITGLELATWALVRQVTKLLATKGIIQDEAAEWKLYSDGMDVTDYTYAKGYRVGQHGTWEMVA